MSGLNVMMSYPYLWLALETCLPPTKQNRGTMLCTLFPELSCHLEFCSRTKWLFIKLNYGYRCLEPQEELTGCRLCTSLAIWHHAIGALHWNVSYSTNHNTVMIQQVNRKLTVLISSVLQHIDGFFKNMGCVAKKK